MHEEEEEEEEEVKLEQMTKEELVAKSSKPKPWQLQASGILELLPAAASSSTTQNLAGSLETPQ